LLMLVMLVIGFSTMLTHGIPPPGGRLPGGITRRATGGEE
jgi:hypothetical protein